MLLALPLILALAGVGGYCSPRAASRRSSSMAEQARRISGSNLDTRIEIGHAAEELTVLVASFNELLGAPRSILRHHAPLRRRRLARTAHAPLRHSRRGRRRARRRTAPPPNTAQRSPSILDESRRLSRLVDDLLNLARADAGRVRLQVEDFYLNELLADCCRSVQPLAAARSIALDCRARSRSSLPRRRRAAAPHDAQPARQRHPLHPARRPRLRRLSNRAATMSPSASPTPAPASRPKPRRTSSNASTAPTSAFAQDGGFGLGLAIVKWIAESHHGAVDLSTIPGSGSVFTVRLPRPPIPAPRSANTPANEPPKTRATESGTISAHESPIPPAT